MSYRRKGPQCRAVVAVYFYRRGQQCRMPVRVGLLCKRHWRICAREPVRLVP